MTCESPHAPGRYLRSRMTCAATLLAASAAFLTPAAQADNNSVEFGITDNPGDWYRVKDRPAIGGSRSIAVVKPGAQVQFSWEDSEGVHTTTSLVWPTGAARMPFESGTLR